MLCKLDVVSNAQNLSTWWEGAGDQKLISKLYNKVQTTQGSQDPDETLIGVQCRVISHETTHTQTTKTDSTASSYIDFEYIHMYVAKIIKVMVTITLRKSMEGA